MKLNHFFRILHITILIIIFFTIKANAIENIDDMALKRKSACEYYLYKSDGMASSRLIDSIENYNNENSNI